MSEKKPDKERLSSMAPFGLRMLPELKQRIASEAEDHGRSMNAEIVARLEASFEDTFTDAVLLDRIRELVVAKRVTDAYGPDLAEAISAYASHNSASDTWDGAVEELLTSALIAEGILPEDTKSEGKSS